jgi:hypothetical protein
MPTPPVIHEQPQAPTTPPAPPSHPEINPWLVAVAVMAGTFMALTTK